MTSSTLGQQMSDFMSSSAQATAQAAAANGAEATAVKKASYSNGIDDNTMDQFLPVPPAMSTFSASQQQQTQEHVVEYGGKVASLQDEVSNMQARMDHLQLQNDGLHEQLHVHRQESTRQLEELHATRYQEDESRRQLQGDEEEAKRQLQIRHDALESELEQLRQKLMDQENVQQEASASGGCIGDWNALQAASEEAEVVLAAEEDRNREHVPAPLHHAPTMAAVAFTFEDVPKQGEIAPSDNPDKAKLPRKLYMLFQWCFILLGIVLVVGLFLEKALNANWNTPLFWVMVSMVVSASCFMILAFYECKYHPAWARVLLGIEHNMKEEDGYALLS